jgi:hypothetical protein
VDAQRGRERAGGQRHRGRLQLVRRASPRHDEDLSSGVSLYVPPKQTPKQEQRDLVDALVAIDKGGFGRVGWPSWARYVARM